MKNLTLEHIAQACQGIYKGSEADKTREVEGISTDSRKIIFQFFVEIMHL